MGCTKLQERRWVSSGYIPVMHTRVTRDASCGWKQLDRQTQVHDVKHLSSNFGKYPFRYPISTNNIKGLIWDQEFVGALMLTLSYSLAVSTTWSKQDTFCSKVTCVITMQGLSRPVMFDEAYRANRPWPATELTTPLPSFVKQHEGRSSGFLPLAIFLTEFTQMPSFFSVSKGFHPQHVVITIRTLICVWHLYMHNISSKTLARCLTVRANVVVSPK